MGDAGNCDVTFSYFKRRYECIGDWSRLPTLEVGLVAPRCRGSGMISCLLLARLL